MFVMLTSYCLYVKKKRTRGKKLCYLIPQQLVYIYFDSSDFNDEAHSLTQASA